MHMQLQKVCKSREAKYLTHHHGIHVSILEIPWLRFHVLCTVNSVLCSLFDDGSQGATSLKHPNPEISC